MKAVFLLGAGFAINSPAWASLVPQIVADDELPSASTLSGLQLNVSSILGPALAGLLVAKVGAPSVFAMNAAGFLLVVTAIPSLQKTGLGLRQTLAMIHHCVYCLIPMALAGACWTLAGSELWVAAQRAMPNAARGRISALMIVLSQGAMTLGGILWGLSGEIFGTRPTLLAIAGLFSLPTFAPMALHGDAT